MTVISLFSKSANARSPVKSIPLPVVVVIFTFAVSVVKSASCPFTNIAGAVALATVNEESLTVTSGVEPIKAIPRFALVVVTPKEEFPVTDKVGLLPDMIIALFVVFVAAAVVPCVWILNLDSSLTLISASDPRRSTGILVPIAVVISIVAASFTLIFGCSTVAAENSTPELPRLIVTFAPPLASIYFACKNTFVTVVRTKLLVPPVNNTLPSGIKANLAAFADPSMIFSNSNVQPNPVSTALNIGAAPVLVIVAFSNLTVAVSSCAKLLKLRLPLSAPKSIV
ncbi:hypothetical protein C240_726 [Enterococcus sp. 5H]|nr:hypothetical protein [Enterococcus sp. 5H]